MESLEKVHQARNTVSVIELQKTVGKLRSNFTILCDSLESIINIENAKLMGTGRVVIPDTCRRILSKQEKFIEKFRQKLQEYELVNLSSEENVPDYAILYRTLISELQNTIDSFRTELITKLSTHTEAMRSLIKENKQLIQEQQQQQAQLNNERKRAETVTVEKRTIQARCDKLEEQLEQKNKRIQQLRMESTVVLWNREKKKLIGSIHSREQGLEQQLRSATGDADETKLRLEQRIEDLQNKLHMMKIKTSKNSVTNENVKTLERNLFIKERLFVVAESELKKQQIYYLSLMNGLRKDFKILKAIHAQSNEEVNIETKSKKDADFMSRIDNIVNAILKGEVRKLRSLLPSHYLSTKFNDDTAKKLKSDFMVNTNVEGVNLENVDLGASLVRWRLGDEENIPTLGKLLKEIQREHPSLVDADGKLQMKEAKNFFPTLNEGRISNYFNLFMLWDDNNDFTLDTAEILHNLPGMLGYMSTTEEVADAIREIDIDESGSVDFYEFLLLVKMLETGEGKSSFFQKNELLKATSRMNGGSTISKTCSIQ